MKMEQTEFSEMSAYKFQTPGNHPKESIQHSVHGESLKSRNLNLLQRWSKKVQIPNFKKIRSVEAEFWHTDGQTDMKFVASFRKFRERAGN